MARVPALLAAAALAAAVAALITACQATLPSPTPAASPAGTGTPPAVRPSAAATSPPTPAAPPSSSPPATPSPHPSAPASPSPAVTASPAQTASPSPIAGDRWRYLVDFPAGAAIEVAGVGRTADGFVAVGSEPAEGQPFFGLRQGVVWISTDGMSWQRSEDDAFANATLLHVVEVQGTTYVLGVRSVCILDEDDCRDLPDAGMTVWRRDEAGGAWERLPQSDEMRDAFVAGVVVLDGSLVAFGDRPHRTSDALLATVWVSDDGMEWQEVTDLARLDPISAAAVGPDGLVAFGTRFIEATDRIETVAAFSEDGRTFQPAAVPPGLDVVIESIAFGDAGFVAAGAAEDAQFLGDKPAILVSVDGRSWSQAPLDDSFAGAGLHQVRELPEGYLLIGFRPGVDDPQRNAGISWLSADGQTWSAAASLAGGEYRLFSGSAVGPAGAVAFALDYEEEPTEGPLSTIRVWFAPMAALRPR